MYGMFGVDICFSFGDILGYTVGPGRFGPIPTGRSGLIITVTVSRTKIGWVTWPGDLL